MSGDRTPSPWVANDHFVDKLWGAEGSVAVCFSREHDREADAAHIVLCVNAHDELVAASQAALAYDQAIQRCANDPSKMTSGSTAAGDDLDELYADWLQKSRSALARATP